jgi:hypothetical protein
MLWHMRLGHAPYHVVKQAPNASEGMDVDFSNLNVDDMPACATCTSMGQNPFEKS